MPSKITAKLIVSLLLSALLMLPCFASESGEIVEPSGDELISVIAIGAVELQSEREDYLPGELVRFSLSLGEHFVLRGVEIIDQSTEIPVDFEVVGYYQYEFVLPEGGAEITVRSENHDTVSRVDAVYRLWRFAGSPIVEYELGFTDVPEDSDYLPALRWAADEGLISADRVELFRPDDPLLREELATVLRRYADELFADEADSQPVELSAVDAEFVSPWAYDSVIWSIENEILDVDIEVGIAGYFRPREELTRAELEHALWHIADEIDATSGEGGSIHDIEPDPSIERDNPFTFTTVTFD